MELELLFMEIGKIISRAGLEEKDTNLALDGLVSRYSLDIQTEKSSKEMCWTYKFWKHQVIYDI